MGGLAAVELAVTTPRPEQLGELLRLDEARALGRVLHQFNVHGHTQPAEYLAMRRLARSTVLRLPAAHHIRGGADGGGGLAL